MSLRPGASEVRKVSGEQIFHHPPMVSNVSLQNVLAKLKDNRQEIVALIFLLALSVFISYWNVRDSGPLWPDASQYANAGAMIHDLLTSKSVWQPYSFAKQNYFQYPAFHLPYHPPGYPGPLGIFFLITGVGYLAARLFISFSLVLVGWFFYLILKTQGLSRNASFLSSILLLTIPEIVFWSRDTMSEVPALALVLCSSYVFLHWLRTAQLRHYLLALCLAEMAFLSRYLTAGVILAWVCWILLLGNWRKLITLRVVLCSVLFLILNLGWIVFTLRFSKYETPLGGVMPNTNYVAMFSLRPVSYLFGELPRMVGWPMLIAALLAAAYLIFKKRYLTFSFWFSWLLCYAAFVIALGIFNERRYFLFALPVFPGLMAEAFDLAGLRGRNGLLSLCIVVLCLVSNGHRIEKFPRGVVGYEEVGRELAKAEAPGNVLVALAEQADLIFRFRSYSPNSNRTFIRADRTLVVRLPSYTNGAPTKIAYDSKDVLDIIQRGSVRYVVTCAPVDSHVDDRTEEMITLDEIARSEPQNFALVKTFPLHREYRPPVVIGECIFGNILVSCRKRKVSYQY